MKRSPLLPGPGPKRKTPLKPGAPLKIKKRGFKVNGADPIPPKVINAVRERSGGLCEAQTPWCKGVATQLHHIGGRGPGKDAPDNLLHVCGGMDACHPGYIHSHPEESYRRGWMVKRLSVDPRPASE